MQFEPSSPKNNHPQSTLSDRIQHAFETQNINADEHARLIQLTRKQDAFKRSLFNPGHFTASAFVFSPERDAVLLIKHTFLRLWLQPGGHIEENDASIVDAMLVLVNKHPVPGPTQDRIPTSLPFLPVNYITIFVQLQ